jgi:hypothetical protein
MKYCIVYSAGPRLGVLGGRMSDPSTPSVQCSVQSIVYSAQCPVYSVLWANSLKCTVCSVQLRYRQTDKGRTLTPPSVTSKAIPERVLKCQESISPTTPPYSAECGVQCAVQCAVQCVARRKWWSPSRATRPKLVNSTVYKKHHCTGKGWRYHYTIQP